MKHFIVSAAAAITATLPAMAQTPEKFDLVCAIDARDRYPAREERYSVDLAASKWCGPRCIAPEAIAEVKPDYLLLKNMGPISPGINSRNDKHTIKIQRADGAYRSVFAMRSAGLYEVDQGACSVAAFTPFPKTMF